MDLPVWFVLALSDIQLYGLIFILGSFTVASLSDIKYMKAQAEFGEVWLLCFIGFVAYDAWNFQDQDKVLVAAKWAIVIFFMATSNTTIGILFKLAWGDIFASIAIMAMLPLGMIVIFLILLWILKVIMKPFLKVFGTGDAYPFMPVVMGATLAVLALSMYLGA